MNQTLLTIFVAVTAIAVVLQMAILAALYFTTKKTTERMNALAKRVEDQALPAIENARTLLAENTPRINALIADVTEMSASVRARTDRIGVTVDDIVDRTRLQVIRADEMITKSFDRIEQTAETVSMITLSPVRKMSGVLTGLAAGIGEFLGGRKVKRTQRAVPRDEMFI